jgi:heme-degrading monooxygenase HmoA
MSIRVVITCSIKPEEREDFEKAYLEVTENVRGTQGHIRDMLLRDTGEGTHYCLIAEWENEGLFREWADDPEHIQQSAAMFPYWVDSFQRQIYEVRATLESYAYDSRTVS